MAESLSLVLNAVLIFAAGVSLVMWVRTLPAIPAARGIDTWTNMCPRDFPQSPGQGAQQVSVGT